MALTNLVISHDELVFINNELGECSEMKGEIRNLKI